MMKTRAWDGKRWRTDYVIMPNGVVCHKKWHFDGNAAFLVLEQVDWKLSRFTGLLDKNVKEIYEGDIVRVEELLSCESGSYWKWFTHVVEYKYQYFIPDDLDESVVIGNIFENPELLEV